MSEGRLVAISPTWGLEEILLPSTGSAKIDAQLWLVVCCRGRFSDQETAG